MGQQFCNRWKESSTRSQQHSFTRTYSRGETADLPWSKGPEPSSGKGTLLYMEHWGNHWKIPWDDQVYHCRFQQRLLDGGTSSWIEKVEHYGSGHWKVPVDKTSNGFHRCTGCFQEKTWCDFPWCARCHSNSQWHDHLWKNRPRAWWKSPELFGSV